MKTKLIIITLCAALMLSGCSGGSIYSNYREVEELSIIQTMGFDKTEKGILLSVSTGNSGGEEKSSGKTARMAAEAATLSLAQDKLQDYSPSEDIFFAHTSYVLLGKSALSDGTDRFFEFIQRSTDFRLDIPVFAVLSGNASEIVLGAGGENYDATTVLRSLERNLTKRGSCYVASAGEISVDTNTNGSALICAVICVKADNASSDAKPDEFAVLPTGYAVINGGKLIGTLDMNTAMGADILRNRTGPATVELGNAAVQLDKCSCDIKPVFDGDTVTGLDIKLKVSAALSENADNVDTSKLNKALADELKSRVDAAFSKAVALNCDFIQLGAVLEAASPVKLHGFGRSFGNMLSELSYNINAVAEIHRSFDLEYTEGT